MSKRNKNKKKKHKDHGGAPRADEKPHARAESSAAVAATPPSTELERLSGRGKKTIAGGIAVLALGFFVLTLTDPAGRNWASTVSPILILGAYAIVFYGIFLPDPVPVQGGEGPEKTQEAGVESSPQPR